ncbi:MAG: hypothetical protein WCG27_06640, partial [Pseudomonadota bacterium]
YYAHALAKKENHQKSLSQRGGASVLACALAENILTLAAAGNCLAYLYRLGQVEVLIYPDCASALTADDSHRARHTIPNNALGLFEDLSLQMREVRLLEGDLILFMTDGAYSRIRSEEIRHFLQKETNLTERIDQIFHLSNERGNWDNQTALALQF